MADEPGGMITASIDDYLLALADGIHKAQVQLSRMRIPAAAGQPAVTYQLPRLDFELKMTFEVSQSQRQGEDGPGGGLALRARPVNPLQTTSQDSTASAASVIKGSFIAVPSEGGKPPTVTRITLNRLSSHSLMIRATLKLVTGESEVGVPVQFNIDRPQSQRINEMEGFVSSTVPPGTANRDKSVPEDARRAEVLPGSQLRDGVVLTNQDGLALTILELDPNEPLGKHVAIIIDIAGETETEVFKVEANTQRT